MCVCVLFQILFHCRVLQDPEFPVQYSRSLCLSVLYVIKLYVNPKFLTCPCFPFGNHKFVFHVCVSVSLAGGSDSKESACRFFPRLGRSPREGNGNPFQYSCLENSRNRGDWQAMGYRPWDTGHGIAKSWT